MIEVQIEKEVYGEGGSGDGEGVGEGAGWTWDFVRRDLCINKATITTRRITIAKIPIFVSVEVFEVGDGVFCVDPVGEEVGVFDAPAVGVGVVELVSGRDWISTE